MTALSTLSVSVRWAKSAGRKLNGFDADLPQYAPPPLVDNYWQQQQAAQQAYYAQRQRDEAYAYAQRQQAEANYAAQRQQEAQFAAQRQVEAAAYSARQSESAAYAERQRQTEAANAAAREAQNRSSSNSGNNSNNNSPPSNTGGSGNGSGGDDGYLSRDQVAQKGYYPDMINTLDEKARLEAHDTNRRNAEEKANFERRQEETRFQEQRRSDEHAFAERKAQEEKKTAERLAEQVRQAHIQTYRRDDVAVVGPSNPTPDPSLPLARFHEDANVPGGRWHASLQELQRNYTNLSFNSSSTGNVGETVQKYLDLPNAPKFISRADIKPAGDFIVEISYTASGRQQAKIEARDMQYSGTAPITDLFKFLKLRA